MVTRLALGFAHTCALRDDGSVWCWGDNARLQVGSDGLLQSKPVRVQGLDAAKEIAAGAAYTCALLESGQVACWGENVKGELGVAPSPPQATPVIVALPGKAVFIAASLGFASYACAILESGAVSCWGSPDATQRCGGPSSVLPANNPALAGATRLVLGFHDTCAVFADGHLACCGENDQGQLGNGTSGTATLTLGPTVPALTQVAQAAMGEYQICAVDHGKAYCWGDNVQGQLCLDPQGGGAIKAPTIVP
ncbi:MAG: RCC1 repeat-containing protein, partial [Minicystis sp.]